MPEPVPEESPPIAPDVIAKAVVQLALAVEQTSELLVAATELHRRVADLHGTLTENLVELERVLAAGRSRPDETERPPKP